jgi:hypothetical protein
MVQTATPICGDPIERGRLLGCAIAHLGSAATYDGVGPASLAIEGR